MLFEDWFWWLAIGATLAAWAMIALGLGRVSTGAIPRRARDMLGIVLLGLALVPFSGESAWRSWPAVPVSIGVAGIGWSVAGAQACLWVFAAASAGGSISTTSPDAVGTLIGASLIVLASVMDLTGIGLLRALSDGHAVLSVVVLAIVPFTDAPAAPVAAVSAFASVLGVLWWRMRPLVDRALFGRPNLRSATLASLIAAVVVMIAMEDGVIAAASILMFATIATLVPFFSSE